MSSSLNLLARGEDALLYEAKIPECPHIPKYIVSSSESRAICNDPFVVGVKYTRFLSRACEKALKLLSQTSFSLPETSTVVLHILRGGLNFGLREALANAYNWNAHGAAFVSAQRARKKDSPTDWIITESDYQKFCLQDVNHIVFGDVVATGTSLEHALRRLGESASQSNVQLASVTFFTIGSPHSHEILERIDQQYRKRFKSYQGSRVIYFEGIFAAATTDTPMSIKIDGTDLLRTDSVLAPEFFESQYDSPAYPLERCTIYDAGSRAFELREYFHDVKEYWHETLELAKKGMSFQELIKERMPELDATRFGKIELSHLCQAQLAKIP